MSEAKPRTTPVAELFLLRGHCRIVNRAVIDCGYTVGGLIPLALEGGPLWEPMCYVQIAGMLVATLVTLVIVPVLYVVFVEDLHLVRWEQESAGHHNGEPAVRDEVVGELVHA